jgi:uncharacterized protein
MEIEGTDGPERWLVASELHLGLESELSRRGAFLRSRTDQLAEDLLQDAKAANATRLLLLGDVKHKVAVVSRQEARDVPRFFDTIHAALAEIVITPGNHDAGLAPLLPHARYPKLRIGRSAGEMLGKKPRRFAALHGHRWPRPALLDAEVILVGHTHAAASLVDETGSLVTQLAWLRGRASEAKVRAKYGKARSPEIIVFPPYNPLCGGTAINRDGLLGPFGELVDAETASLWLLNGRRAMDLSGVDLRARRRRQGEMD